MTEHTATPRKDLLRGVSKQYEKFTVINDDIHTVESFDLVESKGRTQAKFRIGGENITLTISPEHGVGHEKINSKTGKPFIKFENPEYIKSMSFKKGNMSVNVDYKEDIDPILSSLDFGTKVTVEMDNGFVFDGMVCDPNRAMRYQFFKIFEAMADKLGLTIGRCEVNGYVEKRALLRQGKPVTSWELKQLFDERGKGATIQCAFSKNNLKGKTSLYNIAIPENRKA